MKIKTKLKLLSVLVLLLILFGIPFSFATNTLELNGVTEIYQNELQDGFYQGTLELSSMIQYGVGITEKLELELQDTNALGILLKQKSETTFELLLNTNELTKNYYNLILKSYGVNSSGEVSSVVTQRVETIYIEPSSIPGNIEPELSGDNNLSYYNQGTKKLETYFVLESDKRVETFTNKFILWENSTPRKQLNISQLEVTLKAGNEYFNVLSSGDYISFTVNRENISQSGTIFGEVEITGITEGGDRFNYLVEIETEILSKVGYDSKFYKIKEVSLGDFLLIGSEGITKSLAIQLELDNETINTNESDFEYSFIKLVTGIGLDSNKLIISNEAEEGSVGIKIAWKQDPTIYTIRYFTIVKEGSSYIDINPDQDISIINKADNWESKTFAFTNRCYKNGGIIYEDDYTLILENLDTQIQIESNLSSLLSITNSLEEGDYVLYGNKAGYIGNKLYVKVINDPSYGFTLKELDITCELNTSDLKLRSKNEYNRVVFSSIVKKSNASYYAPIEYNLPMGFSKISSNLIEVDNTVTDGVYKLEVFLQDYPNIRSLAYLRVENSEVATYDFDLIKTDRTDLQIPKSGEKDYYILSALDTSTRKSLVFGSYFYSIVGTSNIQVLTENGITYFEVKSGVNEQSYPISLHYKGVEFLKTLTFKQEKLIKNNYKLTKTFDKEILYKPMYAQGSDSYDLGIEVYNNNTYLNTGLITISVYPSDKGVTLIDDKLIISDTAILGDYKINVEIKGNNYFSNTFKFTLKGQYENPIGEGYSIKAENEVYLTGEDRVIDYIITYYVNGERTNEIVNSSQLTITEGVKIDGGNNQLLIPKDFSGDEIIFSIGDTQHKIKVYKEANLKEVNELYLGGAKIINVTNNYATYEFELKGTDINGVRVLGGKTSLIIIGNNHNAVVDKTATEGKFLLNTGRVEDNCVLRFRGEINNIVKYWDITVNANPDVKATIRTDKNSFKEGDSIYVEVEISLAEDISSISNVGVLLLLYKDDSTLLDYKETTVAVTAASRSKQSLSFEIPRGVDYTVESKFEIYIVRGNILSPISLIEKGDIIRYER